MVIESEIVIERCVVLIEKVKNGKYPFAHIPRPLTDTENMEKVSTLLKHMGVWL